MGCALGLLLLGCDWVALAAHALSYETARDGATYNVVADDTVAYGALGAVGVVRWQEQGTMDTLPLPEGMESVDDVAVADGLLFLLDARKPGHLAVMSTRGRGGVRLVSAPRPVDVAPFSGVSARDGIAVVSGGTSRLSVWRYAADGALHGPVAFADLGRGQPDVLLGSGQVAYVSTHYGGPRFGIDILRIDAARQQATRVASLPLQGAGFTKGGARPASFPIELALLNDTTLLVASARGLDVVNVANAARPLVLRTLPLGAATNVDAVDGTAAISLAGDPGGVVLVDLRRAHLQDERRLTLEAGTNPAGVAFSRRAIVIAARGQGMMSRPRQPTVTEIER